MAWQPAGERTTTRTRITARDVIDRWGAGGFPAKDEFLAMLRDGDEVEEVVESDGGGGRIYYEATRRVGQSTIRITLGVSAWVS